MHCRCHPNHPTCGEVPPLGRPRAKALDSVEEVMLLGRCFYARKSLRPIDCVEEVVIIDPNREIVLNQSDAPKVETQQRNGSFCDFPTDKFSLVRKLNRVVTQRGRNRDIKRSRRPLSLC
jgi:hypothetical protein